MAVSNTQYCSAMLGNEKMASKKKMVSFNPLLLQAIDAVAKARLTTRSALIAQACENYPEIFEVLEGLQEARKAVNNE